MGLRGYTSGKKAGCFHHNLLSKFPGNGAQNEERSRQKVCHTAEDESGRLNFEGMEGEVKICS